MKWLKPVLLLVACAVAVPVTALILYETGELPYKVYVVHTGSMSPAIPSKSAVVVEDSQYKVGDVVTFRVHGMVVTHRLVAINPNGTITTKGDANRTADPWHVPKSQIIGSVIAAPHLVGYFLTYVKNPAGFASIVVGFFCLWQIWALAKVLDDSSASEAKP